MQFKKYQHVERLGTVETDGILNGNVYIFPKLDGTNTSLYLNDKGEVEVASRNRVVTPEHDNAGAYAVLHNQKKFKRFFEEFPNWRLYGEWLVPHTVRNYRDDAWRKFYVFDVVDENDKYIDYYNYASDLWRYGIHYIPLIITLESPTVEEVDEWKDQCDFLTKEGTFGEGIVIKNYDFVNKYGRTTWAKIVRSEARTAIKLHKPIQGNCIEADIVDAFVTSPFVEKEFAKIVNDNGGRFENKLINRFLGVLWYTFITEEMFNILRKFKNVTIDFKMLHDLTIKRVKDIKADIFN